MEEKKKRHIKEKICQNYQKNHQSDKRQFIEFNRWKCRIQRYSIERFTSNRKSEKKRTFGRENLEELQKNWQFDNRKFSEFKFKSQGGGEMHNSMVNSAKFGWRCKSKRKSHKKRNKKDIWKRKFVLITKNFRIWQEKIQLTGGNAEFNDIRLNDSNRRKGKKKDIWKREFVLITKNFRISQGKIH